MLKRSVVVLAVLLCAACAESTSTKVTVDDGRRAPPACPSYSRADLESARALMKEQPPPDGDIEPWVVLASQPHPYTAVVLRADGSVHTIDNYYETDDADLYLLAQPGDLLRGDFVFHDDAVKHVTLVVKQAVTIRGCHR